MAMFPSWWARGGIQRREARAGLLFVLPWLLSLLILTAYPVLATFYLSFTDYNVVQPPTWVGLHNYRTMLTADPAFWTSIRNTAFYCLLAVPLGLVGSLGLALLLNLSVRGLGIYRTLVYLPVLAPPVASTLIFIGMFDPDGGPDQCYPAAGWAAASWLAA